MLPNIIEGARIRLRPFGLQDMEAVLSWATDREWVRYLAVPQPYTKEDAERFIARQLLRDHGRNPAWAIEHAGMIRGGINIRFDFDNRFGEMGYSIAREYWRKGLMTEAASLVLDAAFLAYDDLTRICAKADARNTGSLRVMEKIGMKREGTLRQRRVLRGESIDEAWCGILRREWQALRR